MLALCKLNSEEQKDAVPENPVCVEMAPDTDMKHLCRKSFYHNGNLTKLCCTEKLERTFVSSREPYQEPTQVPINSKLRCLDPDGSVKIWPYYSQNPQFWHSKVCKVFCSADSTHWGHHRPWIPLNWAYRYGHCFWIGLFMFYCRSLLLSPYHFVIF